MGQAHIDPQASYSIVGYWLLASLASVRARASKWVPRKKSATRGESSSSLARKPAPRLAKVPTGTVKPCQGKLSMLMLKATR